MALTTAQIVTEVRAHLGGRTDMTDALIAIALNLMQQRIARAHDFEELRTIESGTLTISGTPATDKFLAFSAFTNSNPREIYSFRFITNDGESRKLEAWTYRKLDTEVPEPEFYSTGTPSVYVQWAKKFEFWRVPDTAIDYEVRLSTWPTALDPSGAPSATLDFDEKDDLLITLATSYMFGRLGEYERAGRFWNIFREMWKEGKLEDDLRPDRLIAPGYSRVSSQRSGTPWLEPFVRSTR